MPTYVYRREDGSTFEMEQRITEEPLEECPATGQRVERVITGGTGLIFKGSGFYLTDYARSSNGQESKKEASAADASSESTTKEDKAGAKDSKGTSQT